MKTSLDSVLLGIRRWSLFQIKAERANSSQKHMSFYEFSRFFLLPMILAAFVLFLYDSVPDEQPSVTRAFAGATVDPPCGHSDMSGFMASWIPSRSPEAITGKHFAEMTRGWAGRKRQEAAMLELRNGNIPDFLRHLKPVHLQHKFRDGHLVHAVVWVMPDYLSIGSDENFLRIPLTRPSAVSIAEEFGFVLPTRKIVDAVTNQAEFRFKPQPLPPGKMMRSSEYFVRHNEMIEEQRRGRPLGELVAGHKKDVVLTNRLLGPERIAIYGWHKKDGKPIQGLSTVHGARYADYSHGIRLVYEKVCIDCQVYSIYDVLVNPELAPVLSYEGLIPKIKKLMHW